MRKYIVTICTILLGIGILAAFGANLNVQQFVSAIYDETSGAAKISYTTGEITGNATIGGDATVSGDATVTGDMTLNGALVLSQCTIAADDVTPSITGCHWLMTSANTGATAITDLDDAIEGQTVCLIGGSDTNSSTIADAGNFNLSAAWTAANNDILCLYIQDVGVYLEVSRSDN